MPKMIVGSTSGDRNSADRVDAPRNRCRAMAIAAGVPIATAATVTATASFRLVQAADR